MSVRKPLTPLVALVALLAGCAGREAPSSATTTRDAIVVLGHRPARDERGIEPETRARVLGGVRLFRAGRAPLVAFTGGHTGPGESEAEVMAGLAKSEGVSAEAIRTESASQDTIENARFTVAMLAQELGRTPDIVLVTSDYHMDRAAELFRCAGARVESAPVALEGLSRWQRGSRRMRERFVRVAFWFFDECERAQTPPR